MKFTFKPMHALLAAALMASLVALLSSPASASDTSARVGLGQASAVEPPMLGNLRLSDPLVRAKYLAEPDMLRFLRATYSEGCSRGLLNQAAIQVRSDLNREHAPEARQAAAQLLESQRIWKMSSFEMEALFGASYLHIANYCDCLMRELADEDLVDPTRGLEVIEEMSTAVQQACERTAEERTERQLSTRKAQ